MKYVHSNVSGTKNMQNEDRLTQISSSATKIIGSPKSLLVHTIFFIGIFSLRTFNISFDSILLILTTLVSLEAIYLAIFIQMTVNMNTQHLSMVKEDVEEIQGDVEEIQEDVDEIQEDVDEISKELDEDSVLSPADSAEKNVTESIKKIEKDMAELKNLINLLNKELSHPKRTKKKSTSK